MNDFVISARNVRGNDFGNNPGTSKYLIVPVGDATPSPRHADSATKAEWFAKVRAEAVWGTDSRTGNERGDILVFVHGYNTSTTGMLERHRALMSGLKALGFKGTIVSFDWPSENKTVLYLDDRHDAKRTAMQLVDDGIKQLARLQTTRCSINVHVLAHSMGAYVLREAFDDADDTNLATSSWLVSQIMLIAGDISATSMGESNPSSESLYRHCTRLTNYFHGYDNVLKISNAKRVGLSPRVGRVGLPPDSPARAVNINCGEYFQSLMQASKLDFAKDQLDGADRKSLSFGHSWYLGNRIFFKDMFETIKSDIDRELIPTRKMTDTGLYLVRE